VFGQLAYDVMDNLELALALRFDSEDREVSNNVPVCTGTDLTSCRAQTPGFAFFSNPYINPAYTVNEDYATSGIPSRSETFEQLQPKLSANRRNTEDFALFASYGYGFRSGGFNSSGSAATVDTNFGPGGDTPLCLGENTNGTFPPACDANSVFNLTDVNDTFEKEVSKAAELGLKS
jgi:iron complex outermembrane receptor protein